MEIEYVTSMPEEDREEIAKLRSMVEQLLAHCPDLECMKCGEILCPHGEPLHFHHDGCPACDGGFRGE